MPKSKHLKTCYLGLGSNLNQPIKQLHVAIEHIKRLPKTQFIQSATWYQSKAWGVTEQADFINTVVEVQTSLSPLALLKGIKIIEYRLMLRQVNAKWHARTIDIDILLYGQDQLNRKELTIPHPLIAERAFVSLPLLELEPILPVTLKRQLNITDNSKLSTPELILIKRNNSSK